MSLCVCLLLWLVSVLRVWFPVVVVASCYWFCVLSVFVSRSLSLLLCFCCCCLFVLLLCSKCVVSLSLYTMCCLWLVCYCFFLCVAAFCVCFFVCVLNVIVTAFGFLFFVLHRSVFCLIVMLVI